MMSQKTFGYLISMLVLGSIGLAVVGWLVEYRTGRPIEDADAAPRVAAETDSGQLLSMGAGSVAEQASRHLAQGERSQATHAMDAAMRATQLGTQAFRGAERSRFQEAHRSIMNGRHELQMGRPVDAAENFSQAADVLSESVQVDQPEVPAEAQWDRYEGAQVINAQGIRVGELERIRETSGGTEAVVMVGGMQDFLGLFDFGGTQLLLPADRLVYGNPQTIGTTTVVLPTFELTADAIRAATEAG